MKKYLQWIFPAALMRNAIALAHEGHEHVAANPLNVEWGLKGAQELINIHPLFVHFPIALLTVCALFYLAGIIFKKENLLIAGKWSLYLGSLSAAVTVWTGLRAAGSVEHGGETHQIMMVHQYLGIAILVLSSVLSLWLIFSKANIPAKGRAFFVVTLLAMAAILTQQADSGGRMVFGHGVGVGKKSMMQEMPSHEHGGQEDHHEAAAETAHDHSSHAHGDHAH